MIDLSRLAQPVLAGCLLSLTVACAATDTRPDVVDQVLLGDVFDSRTGMVTRDGVVTIAEGRIQCAGPVADCDWPDDADIQRHEDALILPGLIDAHVHSRAHYAAAYPASGVTTIRDATSPLSRMQEMRAIEADPARIGPRLMTASPMLDSADSKLTRFGASGGRLQEVDMDEVAYLVVETEDDARETVAALAEAHVDWLKVYDRIAPEALEAIVAAAAEHDLSVMVDLGLITSMGLQGSTTDILVAVDAGVHSVEHLSGLALAYRNLGGDPMAEALDTALIADIAARVAAHDVAMVPTLALIRHFEDPEALTLAGLPGAEPLEALLGEHMAQRAAMLAQAGPAVAADRRLAEALFSALLEQDIAMVAGSDSPAAPNVYPGQGLHLELEALVEAGLTPVQALQAATINAAALLGRDDLGVLEAGAVADITVVSGDPSRTIRDSRNVLAVMQSGQSVDLDAAWSSLTLPAEEGD